MNTYFIPIQTEGDLGVADLRFFFATKSNEMKEDKENQ